ncbi:hypothetical protein DXG03_009608 [Asterophora parasitica]|uniref:DUF6699 domain-containing protein n=1 Tax=Asterophora parasitica TaxID=117018 RepID=A0A9P7G001_9AGAR|nr:hypothetical protein DXG03_009608 [Asterophora parasitica]
MGKTVRFNTSNKDSNPPSQSPSTSRSSRSTSSLPPPTITPASGYGSRVRSLNPLAPPAPGPYHSSPLGHDQVADFSPRVMMTPIIPTIPLVDAQSPRSGQWAPDLSPPPVASSPYVRVAIPDPQVEATWALPPDPLSRPSNPSFNPLRPSLTAVDPTGVRKTMLETGNTPRPSGPAPNRCSPTSTSAQSPPSQNPHRAAGPDAVSLSSTLKAVSPASSSHWSTASSSTMCDPQSPPLKLTASKEGYPGPKPLGTASVQYYATTALSPPLNPSQHYRGDSDPTAKLWLSPTPTTGRTSSHTTAISPRGGPKLHPLLSTETQPNSPCNLSSYTAITVAIGGVAWVQPAIDNSIPVHEMLIKVTGLPWQFRITARANTNTTITVGDVFLGIYQNLQSDVLLVELAALEQQQDNSNLERANTSCGSRGGRTLKRIDWLGQNAMFGGLRKGSDGVWKMDVAY